MGMAASQARFLSLTARKTNVEFEGQQINQQRTTLSNESSNYYSQLCNLAVPTPPSSEDFSKTTYTFTDGSEKNTVNSMIAKGQGIYILNYTQSYESQNVVANGVVVATRVLNGNDYEYFIGANKLRQMNASAASGVSLTDIANAKANDKYLATLDDDMVKQLLTLENEYLTMLQNKYQQNDWFVRYQKNSDTASYEPVFYSKDQIVNADYSDKTGASISSIRSYVYGPTTESREIKNALARVEQDTSGRFVSVFIYDLDASGNITQEQTGVEYNLTATTENDDRAYNDAMNQYNYNKAKYDQEIQSINAKIEIIQAQDKDLELRLKQLDTEENAISTEMDSVKKVISNNIDKSFKTFNA